MAYWRAIDWRRPWLDPLRARGERLCAALDAGLPLTEALQEQVEPGRHRLDAGALRFVPQAALPAGLAYEVFIARHAAVPTRENPHDLFNGLAWLTWPQLKRQLNWLHAAQIAGDGVGARRGPVRDALTLFDENAAWLQAPPALADALARRDWPALFAVQRDAWREVRPVLFGHALLEKLVAPRKPITAHVWLVPPGVAAEPHLVEALTPARLAARPFLALPVLGVPGWWPENEDPAFYDDAAVFRPAPVTPRRSAGGTPRASCP